MSELKPAGYLMDGTEVFGAHDISSVALEMRVKEGRIKPLYAIPEGYHIVAIDPEQEQRDKLESHNEKVKLRDEQLTAAYRAGYNKSPLSIYYTDEEISE